GKRRTAHRNHRSTNVSGERRESAMTDTSTSYFGKATSRVDGQAKVTGAAKYAAEHIVPGLAFGFVVTSAIARGRVRKIHTGEASAGGGGGEYFFVCHHAEK